MTKITLHQAPAHPTRYRALIGRNGIGWAYPLKQDENILEAMIDQQGKKGTATYRFTFNGNHWETNSDPISHTHDWSA